MQVLKIFLELVTITSCIFGAFVAIVTDEPGRSLRQRWATVGAVALCTLGATGLVFHLFVQALSWITGIPV